MSPIKIIFPSEHLLYHGLLKIIRYICYAP